MNPESVLKLLQLPEGKELVGFLAIEAEKLNVLDDITLTDSDEIALEVLSRKNAYKRLKDILKELIVDQSEGRPAANPKEYIT